MTAPRIPESPSPGLRIHLIAIGGTGMAPLACLLQAAGHAVQGSDGPLYPPMSTLLERFGIRPFVGFDAAHLDDPAPDLVIVGNAVPRSNPEAVEAERRGLPRLSMPEALARFFLADRRPLVVAGTHGKTTTTALAAWTFTDAGKAPGYLVGGAPLDLPASFERGAGPRFIIEGDEYNAAYFDRGAKFLHYRPRTLILTSVEYDHADLYPSPEALRDAYRRLIALLPAGGLLVANGDSEDVRALLSGASCRVLTFGLGASNDVRADESAIASTPDGSRFTVHDRDGSFATGLGVWGAHNVSNALAVWAAARADGLEPATIDRAFRRFRGVKRRQEEVGTARGVTVLDDFAHHPTAVRKTLAALRDRFGPRRLVVLFEPRSLTAGRAFFFDLYVDAFAGADRVLLAPIFHAGRLAPEERLDLPRLRDAVAARGTRCAVFETVDALVETAIREAEPGDVVVTMSSGAFGGAARRVLDGLSSPPPA